MSGTLPHWLEGLLGIRAPGAGQGTAWALDHSWPWASWITLLGILFVLVFVLICYLREAGRSHAERPTSLVRVGALIAAPFTLLPTLYRSGRLPTTLLRLSAIALLLFMLAGYVLSLHRTGLPYVVLIVDESASMGIVDHYDEQGLLELVNQRIAGLGMEQATRLNLAKSLLLEKDAALLHDVQNRYKLKLYFVAGAARAEPGTVAELASRIRALEPTGESSRLGDGVRGVLNDLRGTPPSAIVLLTDGINTEGESLADAAAYARRKGVPLFTVALGSSIPKRDLEVSDLLVDEVVFLDDVVNFEFTLTATGLTGKAVKIVLREKSSPDILAETTITAKQDGEGQKVRLPYRPKQLGDFEYVVEVETLPEEIQTENNRQQRLVSVRKEQIRVLMVQAYPNYEFRYLKHMLERDGTIKLSTVLQESDLDYAEQDQSALRVFPLKREELYEYDVIIFGDVNPSFLSASVMNNIHAFVTEKGGGLVFMAGPRFTPLNYRQTPLTDLLPVELGVGGLPDLTRPITQGFQIQPTELGLTNPALQLDDTPEESLLVWQKLPPIYWLFEVSALKPAARVLAEHPVKVGQDGKKLPVICLQYAGAGKVVFHATDETWRWRFRVGDVFFSRYWVQTIRYLSRSKLLGKDRSAELTVDRREYRRGEPVHVRVRFVDERLAPTEDDGVTVMIERAGDKNQTMKLKRGASGRGVFEGTFGKSLDGNYHLWVATPTLEGNPPATDFLVVAPPGEMEHVETDLAELKRASQETKGKFYTLETASRLSRDLPEGRQVKTEPLPPIVLWNQWPCLALFLTLLVGEWVLRKRRGML